MLASLRCLLYYIWIIQRKDIQISIFITLSCFSLFTTRCSYVIVFISNEKSKPNFAAAAAQNKGQRFTKKKRKESKKNKIVFFCYFSFQESWNFKTSNLKGLWKGQNITAARHLLTAHSISLNLSRWNVEVSAYDSIYVFNFLMV